MSKDFVSEVYLYVTSDSIGIDLLSLVLVVQGGNVDFYRF